MILILDLLTILLTKLLEVGLLAGPLLILLGLRIESSNFEYNYEHGKKLPVGVIAEQSPWMLKAGLYVTVFSSVYKIISLIFNY